MNAYSEIVKPDLPNDVVLKVDNVSKKFCRNLKRSMWYGLQDLGRNMIGGRGGKDGFSEKRHFSECRLGSDSRLHTANVGLRKNEFWALRNVSFELKRGECLGLIGQNGCGKSTLLRLIAGIFPPDEGSIAIRGRVGALIALGAGFHPHLTGRENIFLNGAILGLSQTDIRSRFADIVDFAEIGDFLDAPVSTYSSGMRVRLGFSVAAHSCPDLLLVDEVLAVGDAGFRLKCLDRIGNLLEEKSVIFVSHSMPFVTRLSTKAILLDLGSVVEESKDVDVVIDKYHKKMGHIERSVVGDGNLVVDKLLLSTAADSRTWDEESLAIKWSDRLRIQMHICSKVMIKKLNIEVAIWDQESRAIAICVSMADNFTIEEVIGQRVLTVDIGPLFLSPGVYSLSIHTTEADYKKYYTRIDNACQFVVNSAQVTRRTPFLLPGKWDVGGSENKADKVV